MAPPLVGEYGCVEMMLARQLVNRLVALIPVEPAADLGLSLGPLAGLAGLGRGATLVRQTLAHWLGEIQQIPHPVR